MRYRISEVSKMLGISPQTIRFYEKYGITPREKDAANGYRSYDLSSIYTLLVGRQYQNCGFTLSETAELLRSLEVDYVQSQYERKVKEMERELDWYKRVHVRASEIAAQLKTVHDNAGQFITVYCPDFVGVVYSTSRRNDRLTPEAMETISKWGGQMPLTGFLLLFDETAQKRKAGFIASLEDAVFLGVDKDPNVFRLPSRKCIYSVLTGDASKREVSAYFEETYARLRREGIQAVDVPFGRGIVTVDRLNKQKYYTEFWIPVE